MSPRLARGVLVVSSAVLVMVLIVAAASRGGGSADLVGDEVRQDTAAEAIARTDEESTITPPAVTIPPEPAAVDPVAAGLAVPPPVAVRIGAIGVDAEIVPVDVDPDGSLQIPDATHVGWYRAGVAPGAPSGSPVLTAHVDFNGEPGVFLELARVEIGAEVVTVDRTGTERRYVITERYQVDKDDLDVVELFRRGGSPTLTLITCGGVFNERERHYRDNIVVRAVPA